MNDLICPNCRGPLEEAGEAINCTACDFKGRSVDQIADLRCGRWDYYFNPVPRPIMHELVQPIPPVEWPRVIRRFMTSVNDNPGWIDNLVVNGRYAWKLLLDLPEDAVLLDLGCGLGNLAHNLAPQVKQIYAMDLTWERLEFSRLRFSLFNPDDNIKLVAGGDGAYLPFPDNSLDCVTLSGVLEWIPDNPTLWNTEGSKLQRAWSMVAAFFGAKNPRRIQVEFLKEIRRVLKPEGQLFIGIENRLNYEYFTGRPDHHSRLVGGALLPRFLANLYSIFKNRNPYRTYTHSRGGYQRLLRAAGFHECKMVGLRDGYSNLNQLLPFDFEEIGWRQKKSADLKENIRNNPWFVPAFGIAARQAAKPSAPLLQRLLKIISDRHEGLQLDKLTISSFDVTGKDKGIIQASAGSSEIIIKLPFSENGIEQEEHNAHLLKEIHAQGPSLGFFIPEALACGSYQSVPYFVETCCPGHSLAEHLSSSNRPALAAKVFALWKGRLDFGEGRVLKPFDGAIFDRYVTDSAKKVRALTKHPERIDGLVTRLENELRGKEFLCGLVHGDFGVDNIFLKDGEISGLIDWESGDLQGPVIMDVIQYMDSVERRSGQGSDIVISLDSMLKKEWSVPEEYEFLGEAFELCNVDRSIGHLFVIIRWLNHISHMADTNFLYSNPNISRHLEGFLALESVTSLIAPEEESKALGSS